MTYYRLGLIKNKDKNDFDDNNLNAIKKIFYDNHENIVLLKNKNNSEIINMPINEDGKICIDKKIENIINDKNNIDQLDFIICIQNYIEINESFNIVYFNE